MSEEKNEAIAGSIFPRFCLSPVFLLTAEGAQEEGNRGSLEADLCPKKGTKQSQHLFFIVSA
ncbi:MAG: hypothetical protein M3N42_15730 [Cyanobacteriota bacterium]|nr:hypothetical protein [Cyanobacteriota bacterium]